MTGSGSAAATFVYDALGRRAAKNINNGLTYFLYDGWNPVQELAAVPPSQFVPTANMLTGLGIDEFFQRSDANGAQSFISDQLQSTLALTDSLGSVTTSYTYEPFGNVTVTNPPLMDPNPYQFTGRENDGTGLLYYRARYYSPNLQRFTAQDPVELGGRKIDLYGYVANNPIGLIDPQGTTPSFGQKRDVPCGWLDTSICRAECAAQGKNLLKCNTQEEWSVVGGKGHLGLAKWVRVGRFCECSEPEANGGECESTPKIGPVPGPGPVPILP